VRVRQLSLQGFKTFAARTSFQFEEGITAVVGPNGSGKSNLADALRWVLGEQSYATLRGRRTEDVIFSGSSARAPVGMAEVSLLLDNQDGFLPVEFAEVEITRRAHRSGTNEYYLNRRRVRLQDVEEVLGGITSSYVVIHQGLVDEALSLRPKERRLLLEEAAEVRRYHERRQKAQERLEQTETNMVRISDLHNDLLPRLRVLERQSQQARQWADAEATLHQALRAWYRHLWEAGSVALGAAEGKEKEAQAGLAQARGALEEAIGEANRYRQSLQEVQRLQEERRRQEAELRRREADLGRAQAQVEGERRALERHLQELSPEVLRWRNEAASQEERRQRIEEAHAALSARWEQARVSLEEQEQALHQVEAGLAASQAAVEEVQQRARSVAGRAAEVERQLGLLSAREEALQCEEEERNGLLDGLRAQQSQVEEEKRQAEAVWSDLQTGAADLRAREEARRREAGSAQEELERARKALEQARWQLTEVRARLEALEQAALPGDGTPFLQQWARQKGRPPFSLLLARLTIPAGLEAATEAALGPHASALLAADWQQARGALAALSSAQAGRASLLPAGDLRPPPPLPSLPADVEGPLLEQLDCPTEDRPAWACLLGRTLLAGDLEAAHGAARSLPAGWSVVTRAGELVTAEGVVAGGRLASAARAVVRERERQALARAVARAEQAVARQERAQARAQAHLASLEQVLEELGRHLEEQRLRREEQDGRLQELTRDLAWAVEESARHRQRLESLGGERRRLGEERAACQDTLQEIASGQVSLQQEIERQQQGGQAAREQLASVRELLQEARTAWAVVQKERESQQALEEMQRRSAERLQQQIAEGERRLRETVAQMESLEERGETLRAELGQVGAALGTIVWAELPASVSREEMDRWDNVVAGRRQELLEKEAVAGQAALEVRLQQEQLKEVLRRGLSELGPEASAYGPASEALLGALLEDPPEWARAPLPTGTSAEELERRIAHLREEVRRIGPVNPLAEEEYREARERYDFLKRQLQDLQDAARSLHQVIVELDQAMEERFQTTLAAINREFQAYFARLFGGGTASLNLVRLEEQDSGLASLGVEIVARPPGKRAHSLALLSGGERALASAALLFAILKVNPRPFCLLDEVDAMLDEANIGRFRECLEELSAQTQFILITHNRGTIEAARTLYGVSMSEDGTSRVLSLRLEEVAAQP